MRPLTLKFSTTCALIIVAFVVFALNPALHGRDVASQRLYALPSDAPSAAARSPSDTGGQTASPNPSGGFDQEERVRQMLAKEYDELYGDEKSIRQFLNLRGKTADFLGHNTTTDQWLIAESKASDIDRAFEQLRNTTQAFIKMNPDARFEIRLYLDAKNFDLLRREGEIFGWRMNAARYLGWQPEGNWVDATIQGVKILVQRVPI